MQPLEGSIETHASAVPLRCTQNSTADAPNFQEIQLSYQGVSHVTNVFRLSEEVHTLPFHFSRS